MAAKKNRAPPARPATPASAEFPPSAGSDAATEPSVFAETPAPSESSALSEADAPMETSAFVETPGPTEFPAEAVGESVMETPVFVETPAPITVAQDVAEPGAAALVAEPTAAIAVAAAPHVAPPEVAKLFESPVKSMTEIQERVRSVLEKGIVETRGAYAKAKSAADEANTAMETSFTTAKQGVVEINVKVLEAIRTSADANFDFARSILGVKSISDYVALHGEFARQRIEAITGQTKEIATLAQKVATESVEPIKAQVAKSFRVAG